MPLQPAALGQRIHRTLPSSLQAWLDQQEREILIRTERIRVQSHGHGSTLGINLRQIRYRIARLNIAVPNDQDPHDDLR